MGQTNGRRARDACAEHHDALRRGDFERVVRVGATVDRRHEDYPQVLRLTAHAHRRLGNLAAADAMLDEALSLARRSAAIFVERAWLRIAQRRHKETIAEAQFAMTVVPRGDEGRQQRSYAYHAMVHASAHLGAKHATLRAADEWCALAGSDPDVLRYTAAYLAMVGHHILAGERARQATLLAGRATAG